MLLLYLPHFPSESSRFFFDGPGMGQLLTYAGITILACIGYGAFFLVVGLFFRNPIIPAIVLYGWEWLNFLMPPLLKKISVIHYLNSLAPGAGLGRTIRGGCRANACLDRRAQPGRCHCAGPDRRELPHSPHGNPLRQRLREANSRTAEQLAAKQCT